MGGVARHQDALETAWSANRAVIEARWEKRVGGEFQVGFACVDNDVISHGVLVLVQSNLLVGAPAMDLDELALDALDYEAFMTRAGYEIDCPGAPPPGLRHPKWWAEVFPNIPLRELRLVVGGLPILVLFVYDVLPGGPDVAPGLKLLRATGRA